MIKQTVLSVASFAQNKTYTNVANHLIDLFGRKHNYLRISLTEKCNLRCKVKSFLD